MTALQKALLPMLLVAAGNIESQELPRADAVSVAVNAAELGLKGNGSDETGKIQEALNSLGHPPHGGSSAILFSGGAQYGISATIFVPSGVKLLCSGPAFDKPDTMAVFRPLADGITMFRTLPENRQNSIEGCGFQGNGRKGITFIYWDTCVQCRLANNVFQRFDFRSIAIKGGGLLYFDSGFNIVSGDGMAYDMQNEYSSRSANTYYGCGVCTFHDDSISAGMGSRLYGNAILWHHQDVEMKVSADSGGRGIGAALNLCDKVGTGPVTIDGESYFELKEDQISPPAGHLTGIRVCPTKFNLNQTQIVGPGHVGTAVKFDSYMYSFIAMGVEFARWQTGIDTGTGFTASGSPDSLIAGNAWLDIGVPVTNAGKQNQQTQAEGSVSPKPGLIMSAPSLGYVFAKAFVPAVVQWNGKSTTLDLSLGNVFEVGTNGEASTITGFTGDAEMGNLFLIESACNGCVTLTGNDHFRLSASHNVSLPANRPLWFLAVKGQAFEIGTTTADLPTVAGGLPSCNPSREGSTIPVTDSQTNVWGSLVTGGGTMHVRAYCDGTSWTVAAK